MSDLYYCDEGSQCAVDSSSILEQPQQTFDPYSVDSFEKALDLMTEPGTHRGFMSFPVEGDVFNLNLNVSIPTNDIVVEHNKIYNKIGASSGSRAMTALIPVNDLHPELHLFFTLLGNDNEASDYAASNLSKLFHKFYEATSDKYQATFKILAQDVGKFDWHKDRNDDSDDSNGTAEYNIALALTDPKTWFCKASEYERSQYDEGGYFDDRAFEKRCANELLYETPSSSGTIFRAVDKYAAVHTTPPSVSRLFSLVELKPKA